jgi:hypothetical protein
VLEPLDAGAVQKTSAQCEAIAVEMIDVFSTAQPVQQTLVFGTGRRGTSINPDRHLLEQASTSTGVASTVPVVTRVGAAEADGADHLDEWLTARNAARRSPSG